MFEQIEGCRASEQHLFRLSIPSATILRAACENISIPFYGNRLQITKRVLREGHGIISDSEATSYIEEPICKTCMHFSKNVFSVRCMSRHSLFVNWLHSFEERHNKEWNRKKEYFENSIMLKALCAIQQKALKFKLVYKKQYINIFCSV